MVVTALIGTAYVWGKSFGGNAKIASVNLLEFATGGNILRLGTVVAVIAAATLLALTGTLTEGAVALLSGVAGVVLGGLRTQPRFREPQEQARQGNTEETDA